MKESVHANNITPFIDTKNCIICFDADDTLWDDQIYYNKVEHEWTQIMKDYGDEKYLHDELYKTETKNMPITGYGPKAYCLSVIETSLKVSDYNISGEKIKQIYDLTTSLLINSTTPLPGVKETLDVLSKKFKLICLTKGEILDQEHKLIKSGLKQYFQHLEIVSEKTENTYLNLCKLNGIHPNDLIMVGNSFKSDIDPVLKIGGWGIHIPHKTMWAYERVQEYKHDKLIEINNFSSILHLIKQ